MIQQEGKYYLYRHIRLDKNEVFYIGIGTKRIGTSTKKQLKSNKWIYDRAYSVFRKNSKIWNYIASKTTYTVEIVLESDDMSFIKNKEKEFIQIYGRIDLKTGILANMTDGGDGMNGNSRKWTDQQKLNQQNHSSCKKVVKLDDNFNVIATYKSSREASRLNNHSVANCCRNKSKPTNGVTYRYLSDYEVKKSEIKQTQHRKIIIYDNKEWVVSVFCKYVYSILGVPINTTYKRLKKGISPEQCISITNKLVKKSQFYWSYTSLKTNEVINYEDIKELSKIINLTPHAIRIRANRGYTRNGFKIDKVLKR